MAIALTSTATAAATGGIKALVYGGPGAGKTTLASTIPGTPIIISAEAGLMSLRHVDIPVLQVQTLGEVHEAYAFLRSADGAKYDWVVLDSISEIAEVVLAHEKKQTSDPRKAYGALQEQMMDLIRAFRDLPRNIYMTAKMERVKDESAGTLLYNPAMPGAKLAQQIPYLFDLVLALRIERGEDEKLQRWLQTSSDLQYVAKDRSGVLEPFETPSLGDVAKKITQPTEETTNG